MSTQIPSPASGTCAYTAASMLKESWSQSQQASLLALTAVDSARKSFSTLARRSAANALMRNGLPYSKKLVAHKSCVNALSFSREGRWFASAGDDPFVQIWDFHQEDLSAPVWKFFGPRSNVFALAFSASGQYVYSGDTRDIIHQYDLAHLGSAITRSRDGSQAPSWSSTRHDDSIRAISCHPEQDQLFLSAAEDGRIILHDMRANPVYTRAQGVLQHSAEFTGVQYHPTMTNIFATSDNRGQVCLRDVRMAFGPSSQRRGHGIIHQYVTTISKQGISRIVRPEASSLVFDREGRRLGVTMLHHLPTLYSLNDPYPLATFSGRYSPNGTPVSAEGSYSNSCTIKHGNFGSLGSDRDMYYAQGSDDFRTYVWKVPDDDALLEEREVIELPDWDKTERPGKIGYTSSLLGSRYVPVDISTPIARLTGHDSIVNTALIHPHHPYILTAGIERIIRLHSPTSWSPCTEPLELTPTDVRSVPTSHPTSRELFLRRVVGLHDSPEPDDDDDSQTIAVFDHILRAEANSDVFAIRTWVSESDEDGEIESGDDDVVGE